MSDPFRLDPKCLFTSFPNSPHPILRSQPAPRSLHTRLNILGSEPDLPLLPNLADLDDSKTEFAEEGERGWVGGGDLGDEVVGGWEG